MTLETDWDTNSTGVDGSGILTTPITTANQAVDMPNPNQTSHGGMLDTLEGWGATAWNDAKAAGTAVVQAGEGAVETVYTAGKTVATDVKSGVTSYISFGAGTIVFVVLGVGLAIYLIGKGGAVKAVVPV